MTINEKETYKEIERLSKSINDLIKEAIAKGMNEEITENIIRYSKELQDICDFFL